MRVRDVLLTHAHGDHAPGAHLWRLITGARVVASAETAYTLQHHIPTRTAYCEWGEEWMEITSHLRKE